MDVELAALSELREKPAGTLRITAIEYAADTILMPALAKLLPKYPDIKVEVITDYGLSNIVAERYDAGIRLGEQVANDMVAVRIGPDFRMVVVGSPTYFSSRKRPRTPQDLTGHNCINLRFRPMAASTPGNREERARTQRARRWPARVQRRGLHARCRPEWIGVAYLPEDLVQTDVAEGHLVKVLSDWCAPFSGYHLYYPSRHQRSPALAVLVDALRYRG